MEMSALSHAAFLYYPMKALLFVVERGFGGLRVILDILRR
jgi:hypothetical protein